MTSLAKSSAVQLAVVFLGNELEPATVWLFPRTAGVENREGRTTSETLANCSVY